MSQPQTDISTELIARFSELKLLVCDVHGVAVRELCDVILEAKVGLANAIDIVLSSAAKPRGSGG